MSRTSKLKVNKRKLKVNRQKLKVKPLELKEKGWRTGSITQPAFHFNRLKCILVAIAVSTFKNP
ncbi:hypothetical protein [Rossellomorea marisflavi]|uniref:hypothetical protein n=1 Tax=Rossellomorea marisflavi TaxID=189381 RepID=UPI003F9EDB2F